MVFQPICFTGQSAQSLYNAKDVMSALYGQAHFDFFLEFLDSLTGNSICVYEVFDGFYRVDDGAVVSSSKGLAYGFERLFGQFFCEVHRELSCQYNGPFTCFAV